MAVTSKRDNMRLIAIVLGEDSGKVRNSETSELLDYGFNLYKVDLIKSKEDKIGTITLNKSSKEKIYVFPKNDITILGKKSDISLNYDIEFKQNDISLPIKKGSVVGKILVKNNKKIIMEIDAVVNQNVEKIGFFKLFVNTIKDIINGELI